MSSVDGNIAPFEKTALAVGILCAALWTVAAVLWDAVGRWVR